MQNSEADFETIILRRRESLRRNLPDLSKYMGCRVFVCVLLPIALGAELHEAIFAHDMAEIEALIEAGESVDALTANALTPLHFAAYEGYIEAIKALLAAGANIEAAGASSKRTPLHFAAMQGQTEALTALIEAKASVDAQDTHKLTPLHVAAGMGHKEAIEVLMEAGASIEALDKDQRTPLNVAIWEGQTEAVKVLRAEQEALRERSIFFPSASFPNGQRVVREVKYKNEL